MLTDSEIFISGLQKGDLELIRRVPKADLHNHGGLGSKLSRLKAWTGRELPAPPAIMPEWQDFIGYLKEHLHAIIYSKPGFEYSIRAALREALEDGVTILEMSIDAQVVDLYPDKVKGLVNFLESAHAGTAPDLNFRPEIGMNREMELPKSTAWVIPMIESGYFRSIDLYGDETKGPPETFHEVYAYARAKGLKCKAHAGEYLNSTFIQRSIDALQLDAIQHGIQADGAGLLDRLAKSRIPLHICPTSNLRLARVQHLKDHPIRKLFEAGVRVTVNSDDIMIFNSTVSEEFLNLYQAGLFSAEELDVIGLNGLDEA